MTLGADRYRSGDSGRDMDGLRTRKFSINDKKGRAPSSLNEDERSIDIVIASETDQILVYDWEFDRAIPEILVMSGCQVPEGGQVPLLDSHGRYSVDDVFGSVRDIAVDGAAMTGRAFYSETGRADDAFRKSQEGHLTDYSAGFRVLKEMRLGENQTTEFDGKAYEGPCILVTEWALKEVSTCPIGADPSAKARADKSNQPARFSASAGPKQRTKEKDMDERLRAYLIKCGMREDATEEEAWAYLKGLDGKRADAGGGPGLGGGDGKDPGKDPEKVRMDEQERVLGIMGLCERHECGDMSDTLIKEGKSLDQARAVVLDAIDKRKTAGDKDKPGFRVEMGIDGRDKFRDAAQDALRVRSGLVMPGGDAKLAMGYDELTGFSLVELARRSLVYANQSDRGNPMDMVGRALTTSDFPIILANIANMSLAQGYETAEETWSQWAATGSVPDFKVNTIARVSESDDLEEIPEDGEYKHGSRDEAKEQYQIATYGKMFKISRKTIINDDLNALSDVPNKHGQASARLVGDVAYAVLTANSAMGDGVALFHADHANLLASGTVIGTTGMAAGIKAMAGQKDMKGKRRLNIRPFAVLAPTSVEAASEVFFASALFDATDKGSTRANIYAGTKYKRIYEARLDDDSATAWYLLAAKGKTVKVFFLNGVMTPYMEMRQGWNVDGVEYKVRMDVGAKALDWKTVWKNPGA